MDERNKEIAIAILKGESIESVARSHGLSRERGRQILGKVIRRYAPDYAKLRIGSGRGHKSGEIKPTDKLRARAEEIIPLIERG